MPDPDNVTYTCVFFRVNQKYVIPETKRDRRESFCSEDTHLGQWLERRARLFRGRRRPSPWSGVRHSYVLLLCPVIQLLGFLSDLPAPPPSPAPPRDPREAPPVLRKKARPLLWPLHSLWLMQLLAHGSLHRSFMVIDTSGGRARRVPRVPA